MAKDNKKRRGSRAYLNDFERDLTGRYHYRGKLYHYQGTLPRQRALAMLWGCGGASLVLLLAAGCLDGPGLGRCFYVLLPYVAAFVAGVTVCWALGRITAGGDPLREYVYESAAAKLFGRSRVAALFSGITALMCLLHMVLNGVIWQRIVFLLLSVAATGGQVMLGRICAGVHWQCGSDGQVSSDKEQ